MIVKISIIRIAIFISLLNTFINTLTASWTELIGDTLEDRIYSITVDDDGNIYAAGASKSSFPLNTNLGNNDALVLKLDNSGNQVWLKLIGGDLEDTAFSILLDDSGNLYIAGTTLSSSFNGLSTTALNSLNGDSFLVKLDKNNGDIIWTELITGDNEDSVLSAALDRFGNIYLAGYTNTPVFNSLNKSGNEDAFVIKYQSDRTKLWTKLVGSNLSVRAHAIAVDYDENVYITGQTTSNQGDFSTAKGLIDSFICKLQPDGTKEWLKILGGSTYDSGRSIAVDAESNIYFTGETNSVDFDFNSRTLSDWDVFIAKYSPTGTKLWVTVLNGVSNDYAKSISIDCEGNSYVTGEVSGDFETKTFNGGGADVFVSVLDKNGSKSWSKLLGGDVIDKGRAIFVNGKGNVYVAGDTDSTTFLTETRNMSNGREAFVTALIRCDSGYCYNLVGDTCDSTNFSNFRKSTCIVYCTSTCIAEGCVSDSLNEANNHTCITNSSTLIGYCRDENDNNSCASTNNSIFRENTLSIICKDSSSYCLDGCVSNSLLGVTTHTCISIDGYCRESDNSCSTSSYSKFRLSLNDSICTTLISDCLNGCIAYSILGINTHTCISINGYCRSESNNSCQSTSLSNFRFSVTDSACKTSSSSCLAGCVSNSLNNVSVYTCLSVNGYCRGNDNSCIPASNTNWRFSVTNFLCKTLASDCEQGCISEEVNGVVGNYTCIYNNGLCKNKQTLSCETASLTKFRTSISDNTCETNTSVCSQGCISNSLNNVSTYTCVNVNGYCKNSSTGICEISSITNFRYSKSDYTCKTNKNDCTLNGCISSNLDNLNTHTCITNSIALTNICRSEIDGSCQNTESVYFRQSRYNFTCKSSYLNDCTNGCLSSTIYEVGTKTCFSGSEGEGLCSSSDGTCQIASLTNFRKSNIQISCINNFNLCQNGCITNNLGVKTHTCVKDSQSLLNYCRSPLNGACENTSSSIVRSSIENITCTINTNQTSNSNSSTDINQSSSSCDILYNGDCLTTCPPGTEIISKESISTCQSCKESGKFVELGKCVSKCSSEANLDNEKGECLLCENKFILKLENTYSCVDNCDSSKGFYTDSNDSNYCVSCSEVGKFIKGNTCVESCGLGMGPDSNNICKECKDTESKYYLDGFCVKDCPENYTAGEFMEVENTCIFFKKDPTCDNYCLNNGICTLISSGNRWCTCTEGFLGKTCNLTNSDLLSFNTEISQINLIASRIQSSMMNSVSLQEISNIKEFLISVPQLIEDDLVNNLIVYAETQLDIIPENINIEQGKNILDMINNVFTIKISGNTTSNVTELKSGVETVSQNMVNGKNITELIQSDNDGMLYNGESLSIQISDNSPLSLKTARDNKLPIVDYSNCETQLKKEGVIDQNETLYAMNINYDSSLLSNQSDINSSASVSKGLTTILINSQGQKVNSSSCKNIIVKMPTNNNIVDVEKQAEVANQLQTDIFNSTSEFFHDLCFPYPSINDTDITVSSRRDQFNLTSYCSSDCVYAGMDEHHYAICNCTSLPKESVSSFKTSVFGELENSNFNLFRCVKSLFKSKLINNAGFWALTSITILITGFITGHFLLFSISKNISSIVMYDAVTIKPDLVGQLSTLTLTKLKHAHDNNSLNKITVYEPIPKFVGNQGNSNEYNNVYQSARSDLNTNKKDATSSNTNILSLNEKNSLNNNSNKKFFTQKLAETKHNEISVIEINDDLNANGMTKEPKERALKINSLIKSSGENDEKKYNSDSKTIIEINDEKNNNNIINIEPKTQADFEELPIKLRILHDKRTFLQFFWEEIKDKHLYVNILFVKSVINPFFIRAIKLLFDLSLQFALNALFFTDDYINKQADKKLSEGSDSVGFGYTIVKEISKSLWPVIISSIIAFLTSLILIIPKKYKDELNSKLNSNEISIQNEGM